MKIPSKALAHIPDDDLEELLVELCGLLSDSQIFRGLIQGLTGAELDSLLTRLTNHLTD